MILAHLLVSKYHCEYWYSDKQDNKADTIYVNDDTSKTVMEKYCDPEHYETFTLNGRLMIKRKVKGVRDDR